MSNLITKFDEDDCPPLTQEDFKKMRRYPSRLMEKKQLKTNLAPDIAADLNQISDEKYKTALNLKASL